MPLTNIDLRLSALAVFAVLALVPWQAGAGEVRVAVASNFAATAGAIAGHFETASGHRVSLSAASTGKHYAQIVNGAPFDVFLAADARRPARLEAEGIAVPGSRFVYALGRLVLWSPRENHVDAEGLVLEHGDFRHLAIANPRLAPYGLAAKDVLQARGLWDGLQRRLVRGENIAQAYQFVSSGNAGLGFVAYSQIVRPGQVPAGSYWAVPQALYAPVEQQAVMLRDTPAARDFVAFMRSDAVLAIIREQGYKVPDDQ